LIGGHGNRFTLAMACDPVWLLLLAGIALLLRNLEPALSNASCEAAWRYRYCTWNAFASPTSPWKLQAFAAQLRGPEPLDTS
jgi:hypothetical protein